MAHSEQTQTSGDSNPWPRLPNPFALPSVEKIIEQNATVPPLHRIGQGEALTLNTAGTMKTPRGALVDIYIVAISREGVAAVHRGDIPERDWLGATISIETETSSYHYPTNVVETEKIGLELYRSVFLFTGDDSPVS